MAPLIGTYDTTLTGHFFESLAATAGICVHLSVLSGRNPHHIVEAQFKAFARALRDAAAPDPRAAGHPQHQGRAVSPSARPQVVVLDYGSGNLRSAQRALQRAGADVTVTADADAALSCDGLVVPGVGAFAACMAGLRAIRGEVIIGQAAGRGSGRCSGSASACRCCSPKGPSTAS